MRGSVTRLYRAVSDAELEDIRQAGFRHGEGTLETKVFTTSVEDAAFFARYVLFPLDQKPLTIIEVEVADNLGERFFPFITDGKATVAVDLSLLTVLNAVARVQPLPGIPLTHL